MEAKLQRGELQASVEHVKDEHREPLHEAQVRAQAVQTRKSLVSCIGRPGEHRDGQWLLIALLSEVMPNARANSDLVAGRRGRQKCQRSDRGFPSRINTRRALPRRRSVE